MEKREKTLKPIRTDEENVKNTEILNNYIKELDSYNSDPEKWKALLLEELKEHPERIDIKNRLRMINDRTYSKALENNILAHYLAEKEYENGEFSVAEFIRAFIGRDVAAKEKAKKSFRDRFAKSRADDACIAIPIDFSLPSSQTVLDEMFEEYEFINIPKPEMGLVLVDVDKEINPKNIKFKETILKECFSEKGIKSREEKETNNPKTSKTPEQSNIIESIKTSKEKDRNKNQYERDEI